MCQSNKPPLTQVMACHTFFTLKDDMKVSCQKWHLLNVFNISNKLILFQHKDYDGSTHRYGVPFMGNDVALIKLKSPINPNNPYVKPVALDENNGYDWRQHECYAVGWGKTGKWSCRFDNWRPVRNGRHSAHDILKQFLLIKFVVLIQNLLNVVHRLTII